MTKIYTTRAVRRKAKKILGHRHGEQLPSAARAKEIIAAGNIVQGPGLYPTRAIRARHPDLEKKRRRR